MTVRPRRNPVSSFSANSVFRGSPDPEFGRFPRLNFWKPVKLRIWPVVELTNPRRPEPMPCIRSVSSAVAR